MSCIEVGAGHARPSRRPSAGLPRAYSGCQPIKSTGSGRLMQFDLLQVAERDGSGRDWSHIREPLAECVYEEQTASGRTVYRVRAEVAAELAEHCIYVEQGNPARVEPGVGPYASE